VGRLAFGAASGEAIVINDENKKFKIVELSDLKVEDGAKELLSSPDAQIYMNLLTALMQQ
jgi:hypothetical protein